MLISEHLELCYDDVLLKPSYSQVLPSEVSLKTRISKHVFLDIPLVTSAMDTVTHGPMAIAIARLGGMGILHKNNSVEEQVEQAKMVKAENLKVGAAIGVRDSGIKRAKALAVAGVDVIVIDTAHGHSEGVLETLRELKNHISCDIIAGNVATPKACEDLITAGADAIKVGVGPGSICTTRVVAGVGVPQFQAVLDCAKVCRVADIPLIADGGIRHSGDIVKALAAGASTVMIGSLIAASHESASEIVHFQGKRYKRYRGMGSLTAMSLGSKDRYAQSNVKDMKKLVPEGVEGLVLEKGPLADIIYQLAGGLRSGMGYTGANDLDELHKNAQFSRISSLSLRENHPHDILIDKESPNY